MRATGAALALVASALAGCASTPQPVPNHRVGFFESLSRWEKKRAPAAREKDEAKAAPATEAEPDADATPSSKAAPIPAPGLSWPLSRVRVTSGFGKRGREFHEGIDLHARVGTPVLSAAGGTVIYASRRIRGYGNMVVIRHRNGLSTVYAHNSKLFVRYGQAVKQGERIALSGNTGHVRGAHLHFEVRRGVAAVDPLPYLPGKRVASARAIRSYP